ncbi:MAG: amidase family protein, partial [Nocardioidaceae bacterium]
MTSAREAVEELLDRIADVDPLVNTVCTQNDRALDEAERRDRERADGRVRSPVHGIP